MAQDYRATQSGPFQSPNNFGSLATGKNLHPDIIPLTFLFF
jgi:hypothetical protein